MRRRKTPFVKSILFMFLGYLWFTVNSVAQANDQVRFSTENNLLTIPHVIIDQKQSVFDAELQLQSNGFFVLTKISDRPVLQIDLDEPFVLEMDQTAWLKDTNSGLKLTAITEDSRCPIEAICVREGTVSIVFSLFNGIDHTHDYQLSIGSELDIENFRIKLLSVKPAPRSISSKSADYNATFVITSLSGN